MQGIQVSAEKLKLAELYGVKNENLLLKDQNHIGIED